MRLLRFFACVAPVLVSGFSNDGDDFSDTLAFTNWSGDVNVPDPVALSLDDEGRVYVTQTQRRKIQDLDIREHLDWIENDLSFDSVEAKQAFYHEQLSPERSAENVDRIFDMNGDGSHDYHDLTVLSENIYMVEDGDGDGIADKIKLFADGFKTEVTGIAAGVLWDDGDVYATIAPDLWKLRDTDGDHVADEREVVATGFAMHLAYAGHDMHGLTKGPDGKIYWTIGDKGVNTVSQEGEHFYYPNQGALMRCNPDGSDFEVYAHGLRNVQEIAFDAFGNIIGVDNDADFQGEQERLVYIVKDMDAGWRCNYQYRKSDYNPWLAERLHVPFFEGQAAYIVPTIENYVKGPAGFAFNPGTALNSNYKDYFFVNSTLPGQQYAFQLEENGASFSLKNSHSIGERRTVIGLAFGPDGALYTPDWGGGYPMNKKGAIWKIDDSSGEDRSMREEVARLLASDFDELDATRLGELMGHADQRIRLRAQFEIVERKNIQSLVTSVLPGQLLRRIHGVWGLGQLARDGNQEAIEQLLKLLGDENAEVQTQSIKVLGDLKSGAFDANVLVPLLASSSARVSFQAGIALGDHKVDGGLDAVVAMIERNDGRDLYLRHAGIVALCGIGGAHTLVEQASEEVRLCAVVALRRERDPRVAAFLNDASEAVVREAALAIHDDLSIVEALTPLAGLIEELATSGKALGYRVINANFRLGGEDQAQAVTRYLAKESADTDLRIESVKALSTWMNPPVLDRVDGRYREHDARKDIGLLEMVSPVFNQLLDSDSGELVATVVEIATQMDVDLEEEALWALLRNENAPASLRVLALESLDMEEAVDYGLDSSVVDLRIRALSMFAKANPSEATPLLIQSLASSQFVAEQQAALKELSAIGSSVADAAILNWANRLAAGEIGNELLLDVIEAAEARGFTKPLALFDTNRDAGDPLGNFVESLHGGDAVLGESIAQTHIAAQCVRCHRFSSEEGSRVGPNLRNIGQKDRNYILRGLVSPNADIAEEFGLVTILLKDGASFVGNLGKQEDGQVELLMANGSAKLIDRDKIQSITEPMSTMPPMYGILSKRELRDLVAYLSGLGVDDQ